MTEPSAVLGSAQSPNFRARLSVEARAFRAWVAARLEARKHRRFASRGRVEIDDASRALARQALPLAVAATLPSRVPAEAARAALRSAEDAARAAHATADAAREALARADADAAPRMAEARTRVEAARGVVRTLDRAMPPGPGLEAARAALAEAEASSDREGARLRDARAPLAAAMERADLHASAADDGVAAARDQEAATLLAFGRDLAAAAGSATGPASASFASAEIAAPLAAVREAQGAAARQLAGADAASARAHEVAVDARRFAWKAGAALAGLVLLVVGIAALAGSGGGGGGGTAPKETASRGGTSEPAPGRSSPEPVRPAPPTGATTDGAKDPTSILTPAVVAAVLAQPSLAASEGEGGRMQRPLGTVEVDDVRPAAEGGRRLRVRADVERRTETGSPLRRSRVLVEVLLDANGAPAQVREVGEVDAETLELFGD